jgi:alanine-synthesizing transaminase
VSSGVKWSDRIPADLSPSELSANWAEHVDLIDLTVTNPTLCGFAYPATTIQKALSDPGMLTYDPQPLGIKKARQAVARYISENGVATCEDQVVITASTSEAYSYLFRLLCNPGDSVAAPTPSYPLVAHLSALDGVECVPYRLRFQHEQWRLDLQSLRRALKKGVRAVVTVNPNNPTGSILQTDERQALRNECRAAGAAVISDEVFSAYTAAGTHAPSLGGACATPLTFVLDGLSKAAGLPQMKAGWITVWGAEADVHAAMAGLEWISDAYLSVATPVQLALPSLLAIAATMQAAINDRVRKNALCLREAAKAWPHVAAPSAEGGWMQLLRLSGSAHDDDVIRDLIEHAGVKIQPGYFYDFEDGSFLVMSLLAPEATFRLGVTRISDVLSRL